MDARFQRLFVVTVLAVHVLLLAGYTFPLRFAGERLHRLGQWYARPLFHQQWQLFAPEPPPCSCTLEVRSQGRNWRAVDAVARHYLERRIVHNYCHYFAAGLPLDSEHTRRALLRITGRTAEQSPQFRIVEQCVDDPRRPTERITRITPVPLP